MQQAVPLPATLASAARIAPRAGVWALGLSLYAVSALILGLLIFAAPGYPSTDDYYHVRISDQIIVQGRLRVEFPWLPGTLLSNEHFVDHHLLLHLYLAPWVHWGGEVGAKLATVSIAAGVVVAAWVFLRAVGVRWAFAWALGLFAVSAPFLYRLLMVRAQGAALLLLIVALTLLVQGRWRWLIPLAFAYAWLYNGFVLILGAVALYSGAVWLNERRLLWKPVAFTALGLALGLVINPYFPNNLAFIADHLGAKVDFESGVLVGREWYSYTTAALLTHAGGALALLALGALRPSFDQRRRDAVETALLLIALMTLFMLLRSRRFIEYFPAFALLYGAVAWGRGGLNLADWLPFPALARLIPVGVVAAFLVVSGLTLRAARDQIREAADAEYLRGASAWLAEYADPGTPIFHTDWDDFTRLFYYNPANTYLVGLDPTYLSMADPLRWDEWVALTRGQVERPSELIRERFGARYVVSDLDHEDFAAQADADPAMRLVYRDSNALVWEILPG